MHKTAALIILLLSFLFAHTQQDFFVLKKKNKVLQRFTTGSFIIFQLNDGEWISGDIKKIRRDSFYVQPRSVRLTMFGLDTVHFTIRGIALNDIAVMPRKTAMVYYSNDKPQLIHGHEKYTYVKNGLVFQLLGGGYAALNIGNNLFDHNPPFGKSNRNRLFIAAAVFAIGQFLHSTYRQHLHLGKKYHFQYIRLEKDKYF
jgi:hypothetical protein